MKNCLFILLLFVCECAFSQLNDPVKLNDVVINEVFADPTPPVGLPPAEFIELWNTSKRTISLKNWLYSDGSTTYKFSDDSIRANEHVILCARSDTAAFKAYGRVIGLSPWPSLNNAGDHLSLKASTGLLVNEVFYSDSWYQDNQKKAGGFTIELIDPASVCGGIKNWRASNDQSGGTPGRVNSVYQFFANADPLKLTKITILDSITLALSFNRFTDSVSATNPDNYLLNNGVGKPVSAHYSTSDPLIVILKLSGPLTRGNLYKISVEDITDCNGKAINSVNSLDFFLPKKILEGDILISEILFNPRSEGVDFVEIYNHSNHVLDVQELSIGNLPLPDTLNKSKRLSNDQRLIGPGEFLALTSDPEKVKNEYHTENLDAFLKITSFPSYNNDEGIVTILVNKKAVDQFTYTEKMHLSLIKNPDGISLERSDFKTAANEPGNFRSAAASAGFATPGYKNSQYLPESGLKEEFTLSSTTFSPDDDGFEDLMQINYLLSKPGFVANITVYNNSGNIIRKLYQNYTLGTSGILNWDGRDELSELRSSGIYLVYAEFFNIEGEVKKFRKTIILAKKFN